MSTAPAPQDPRLEADHRRRVRRTAILLGALAIAMYLGFILSMGLRG